MKLHQDMISKSVHGRERQGPFPLERQHQAPQPRFDHAARWQRGIVYQSAYAKHFACQL